MYMKWIKVKSKLIALFLIILSNMAIFLEVQWCMCESFIAKDYGDSIVGPLRQNKHFDIFFNFECKWMFDVPNL